MFLLGPALELGGHLVPPGGAAGTAGNGPHVIQAERQKHRLLEPLVDGPGLRPGLARDFLRDPGLTRVEQVQRLVDRIAHLTLRGGRDVRPVLEGGFDDLFELRMRHGPTPWKANSARGFVAPGAGVKACRVVSRRSGQRI